ncbi:MAG: valine--tRNA ligase [Candidatus Aenigmarchaeota archaeon]|nr:valine--tRNA ligase [Candidatus Aenigmarchaeota archaeon]
MEIQKRYDPKVSEKKWQEYWRENKVYSFDETADKTFVIDTPPPFTSGAPHMGHVLWWTWNDIIARFKTMRGFEVLLPQGWDCHGLPTELKVEKDYKIRKNEKEKFIAACKEWTGECITKMKDSMSAIGYSADWDYEYRTDSPEYMAFVQKTLVNLFSKGLIERAEHPVMWCTKCSTTLAKAEVGHVEKNGVLYHIKLDVEGGGKITIATTRPEMMAACVAIFVNPGDETHKEFVGKTAKIPIFGQEVKIIANPDVDMAFGTGAVYLCTYGDEMDIKWQKRYGLPAINLISENGKLNENANQFAGMKIADARIKIVEELGMLGLVDREEKFLHNVLCHTERSACLNPIEFIPMKQWTIKVKENSRDVLEISSSVNWFPEHMKIRLDNWVNSMDWDWVFSRQRVYGTPIPFWYCEKCGKIYPADKFPVDTSLERHNPEKCECGGGIVGEKDVCDGWIDSSITPLIISGYWKDDSSMHKKLYPSDLRQQGHDIIRTWAYYTILRCFLETGKKPWKNILVNSLILGPDGREMHKSLGNVVLPDDILLKHGADTLRTGLIMLGLYSGDAAFNWQNMEFAYKFSTKFWNIFRFFASNAEGFEKAAAITSPMDKWILSRLNRKIEDVTKAIENYQFAYAFEILHDFVWHELADNYLEFVKYRLYNNIEKESAQATLHTVILDCVKMLSPFMPHITEEMYQAHFKEREGTESVHKTPWPEADKKMVDEDAEKAGEAARFIVSAIRKFKTSNSLPLNTEIKQLIIQCEDKDLGKVSKVLKDIGGVMGVKDMRLGTILEGKNIVDVPEMDAKLLIIVQ